MSLIIAKAKVSREQLVETKTPAASGAHVPIPHSVLVDGAMRAFEAAGLTVLESEFALASKDDHFFGGFALSGAGIGADDRQLVVGLRNSHNKSFAASICLGNRMLVCENLCFSSEVNLARRHTRHILADLPRVLADAVSRVTSHWSEMSNRIEAYKTAALENLEKVVISLVDSKALPAREIYNVISEFRNPRHEEFKGGSVWTLYNAVTECLKGGDLSKLPTRTRTMQSILDPLARPIIDVGA